MASLEKDLAAEKLREQARDLYKLKITLPLGNKNLKLVHTNQFLWAEFPENVFKLENWKYIAEALDGDETSHTGYVKNRWFIESCTITNDGNNAKMELELNPFGTNQRSYIDDYESFTKAYEDAQKQSNDNNTNSIPSVASDNSTAPGGEGKEIDDFVAGVIGNKTDTYQKAKALHNYIQEHRHYTLYTDRETKNPTQAFRRWKDKNKRGINCADTAMMVAAMLRSAGVDCYCVHIPRGCGKSYGHYFVVFEYNGVRHCIDGTGKHPMDEYWSPCNSNKKYNGGKVWDKNYGDGLSIP